MASHLGHQPRPSVKSYLHQMEETRGQATFLNATISATSEVRANSMLLIAKGVREVYANDVINSPDEHKRNIAANTITNAFLMGIYQLVKYGQPLPKRTFE